MSEGAAVQQAKDLSDFGHWISPMAVKELRQGLRANGFVIPFVLAHAACILALVLEYASSKADGGGPMGEPGASVWLVSGFVILVVMPLASLGGLHREVNNQNFELLLLAGLSRWRIALGKWGTAFALSLLLLISLFPYLLLLYFFGGVNLWQTILGAVTFAAANSAGVALMIGVSGFKSYAGKIGVFMVAGGSVLIIGGIAGVSLIFSREVETILQMLFAGLAMMMLSALYTVLGMQLIRAHLRAYENPIDPPPTGLIIGMLVTLPMILGLLSAAAPVWGSLIGGGFFLVLAILIDPEKVRAGG